MISILISRHSWGNPFILMYCTYHKTYNQSYSSLPISWYFIQNDYPIGIGRMINSKLSIELCSKPKNYKWSGDWFDDAKVLHIDFIFAPDNKSS